METYASVLNYAIPGFILLIAIEWLAGLAMGTQTIRSMDTIASLSSGLTNIIKDVLGLTVIVVGYSWLVSKVALFEIEATWIAFGLAFVGKDFAGYWQHRLSHRINIFWNEHIIHHSSEEFNLACALRQSISTIVSAWAILYLPLALIGVPAKVIAIAAPIHLFAQFWYHTRLIGRMGFLEAIIVTPSHHRVHHAMNPEYLDRNFAQIFIIWDKLFGTFQKELPEVPPVYGIKRPARTWNPFLIGFQHLWLLVKDAWRTRSWWDKLRIWFMPTGWRPADVAAKYPVSTLNDVTTLEKYNPKASLPLLLWAWSHLILTLGLVLFLFNHLGQMTYPEILWYAGFLFVWIFSYTTLMDRSRFAWIPSLLASGFGAVLFWKMEGWFGIGEVFGWGNALVLGYLGFSLVAAFAFSFFDFRQDMRQMASA
ncbi:MAG: sterol desaturase family protein [Bacteroidota bacterium]